MHGFRKTESLPEHYVLGSGKLGAKFGAQDIMPNGHGWSEFVPLEEDQMRYGFETMDCTVFGTLKALITLARFLGFKDWPDNCSERYNGIMANTTPSGNSPHDVIENIRTQAGVVLEQTLPWTSDLNTWAKYYAPKPLPTSIIAMGQLILKHFTIGHEWVFNGGTPDRPTLLKQALARGTVSASVYAWRENTDGLYYKEPTDEDEHWIQIVDYVDGQYWIVSDQYAPYRKHLVWDYPFYCAKLYALSQIGPVTSNDFQVILSLMLDNLKQLLKLFKNHLVATIPQPMPENTPVQTPPVPVPAPAPDPDALLPWDMVGSLSHENWHNVRVICDLEGLPFDMKEDLCATIWGESEFNTNAKLDNKDKNGRVWSTDAGICQWNSYWHGKEISQQDAFHDPEKAVRLMCKYFLDGQADQWVAHSSGRYLQFKGRTL